MSRIPGVRGQDWRVNWRVREQDPHLLHPCRGFPQQLMSLKARISEHQTGLPKENPGSLWPKTSLVRHGAWWQAGRSGAAQWPVRGCTDAAARAQPQI